MRKVKESGLPEQALLRAKQIVSRYLKLGRVSMVDELLQDRRREADGRDIRRGVDLLVIRERSK